MHLYLDNAVVGFTLSLDSVGKDCMALGGLAQHNFIEIAKLVQNFAVIIQFGQHVILTNDIVFQIWLFFPPNGTGRHVQSLDKAHLMKAMICETLSLKSSLLYAWSYYFGNG